jgi:protein disulfide isomerase family A protein 5
MKVEPEKWVLKHYKDGEFHKDYDRALTLKSMVTFLRDPTGQSSVSAGYFLTFF